jgi:hypothetical protein
VPNVLAADPPALASSAVVERTAPATVARRSSPARTSAMKGR